MEIEIYEETLEVNIVVKKFPSIEIMENMDFESYYRLCSDIERKSEKFVERRRSPKKGTLKASR